MLSHRLDFAHSVIGPIARVTAQTHQIWATRLDDGGQEHESDTEDWVGCLAQFERGTTGVFESVKTADRLRRRHHQPRLVRGERQRGRRRLRAVTAAAYTRARKGAAYETLDVPSSIRKIAGSPRDP